MFLGVTLLRVNDKKSAKVHGVRNFPALSLIRFQHLFIQIIFKEKIWLPISKSAHQSIN